MLKLFIILMAFYKIRQNSAKLRPRSPTKAETFEEYWKEFDTFYLNIIGENPKIIKEAKRRGKSLL